MAQVKQLFENHEISEKIKYEKQFGFYEGMESEYTKLMNDIGNHTHHLAKLQEQIDDESANQNPKTELISSLEFCKKRTLDLKTEAKNESKKLKELMVIPEYAIYQELLLKLGRTIKQKPISTSNARAKKTVQTPFGKVVVTIDILSQLRKTTPNWQQTFCTTYGLENKQWDDKVELRSNDFDIRATKNGVEADCKNVNSHQKLAQAMVELYLKALEGQNDINHKVKSDDPKLQSEIEQMLAKTLIETKNLAGTINDMQISSFQKPAPDVAQMIYSGELEDEERRTFKI